MKRSSSIRMLNNNRRPGGTRLTSCLCSSAAALQLTQPSGYFYPLQLGKATKESSVFFLQKKL